AEPQEAVRVESVMERGQQLALKDRLEIDEEITADDEVDARERRLGQRVVTREDAHVADGFRDAVAAIDVLEELSQPRRRDVLLDALRIDARPRGLDADAVGVGR